MLGDAVRRSRFQQHRLASPQQRARSGCTGAQCKASFQRDHQLGFVRMRQRKIQAAWRQREAQRRPGTADLALWHVDMYRIAAWVQGQHVVHTASHDGMDSF